MRAVYANLACTRTHAHVCIRLTYTRSPGPLQQVQNQLGGEVGATEIATGPAALGRA